MKATLTLLFSCFAIVCFSQSRETKTTINKTLDAWHQAAARADFEAYFDHMTADGIFIGTDAAENWTTTEFKAYSKPYFDKGRAWSFTPLERNIYSTGEIVYFDELLKTQMGLCRGSGILVQKDDIWKIAHYVLSIAVPNESVAELTVLKATHDKNYADSLQVQNRR